MKSTLAESADRTWKVGLAVGWLGLFGAIFFSRVLPNSNPPLSRSDIWIELPDIFYYCFVAPPDSSASWQFVGQRLPFVLIGSWILGSAWGLGHWAMRGIERVAGDQSPSLPTPLSRQEVPGRGEFDNASATPLSRQEVPGRREQEDDFRLTRLEHNVFAVGIGLAGVSLIVLGCGLLAQLVPGMMSAAVLGTSLSLPLLLAVADVVRATLTRRREQIAEGDTKAAKKASPQPSWLDVLVRGQIPYGVICRSIAVLVMSLFVLAIALGSMLPEIDFDVKEYHLGGPKEWFQTGSIHWLPHNVYTSFPFLTEMHLLLGMVLHADWFWGALAGKFVLAAFGVLTTLAVFAAARRWFGNDVAWTAALIHLSTPWTYRISVIAYAEGGATFYLFAALWAAALAIESRRRSFVFLAGLMAGSSMACKYPGLISVVVPIGAALCWASWTRGMWSTNRERSRIESVLPVAGLFATGVALAVGPWLLKNFCETGNPVYPLANSVFHGADWTPILEANWKRAHGPGHHDPSDIAIKLFDVTFKSDWLSPLLFSLAPLALLTTRHRRLIGSVWLFVGYLFATWWVMTHRLDRFWIPLIPLVSLLAGVGAWWSKHLLWRSVCGGFVALCVLFNLGFITLSNCGFNGYLMDLKTAASVAATTAPTIEALNRMELPAGSKVLLVGEAQIFEARFPLAYNTGFDISLFEQWCAVPSSDKPVAEWSLRPIREIRDELRARGITHVFVNWQEILRYRTSGYGYSDFVTPSRFEALQRGGVLGSEAVPLTGLSATKDFLASDLAEVNRWAPELIVRTSEGDGFLKSQLFVVREE